MTSKEILALIKGSSLILHPSYPNIIEKLEEDLEIAKLINDELYFLSFAYKNASKKDLLELFILYANAFKVIDKCFDVKCFIHSNYSSYTLEIYQDNERKATAELFGIDQGTFSALYNLRWSLKNES